MTITDDNDNKDKNGKFSHRQLKAMSKIKSTILLIITFFATFFSVIFFTGVKKVTVINNGQFVDNPPLSFKSKMEEDGRWDILILGTQPIGGLKNGLTDSIMMFSYKKDTQEAAIFSIPRDLWVKIPGFGMHKINEAYVYGETKKPNGGGIALAKQVVSSITGLEIDFAVVVDIQALKKIVDTLGGIDVYEDKYFSGDLYGNYVKIHPGVNHLNGSQTLAYIGVRSIDSDFKRMERQQKVFLLLKDKIFSLNLLSRPDKILSILNTVSKHIRTDFPLSQIQEVIQIASSFDVQNVKKIVFDTSNYLYHPPTDERGYILLPKKGDFSEIKKITRGIFEQNLNVNSNSTEEKTSKEKTTSN